MTIQSVYDYLDGRAPFATAEEWDNPGLLVGSADHAVTGILVALDATPGALEAAVALGANLIVTHHPLIFAPLKRLDAAGLPYQLAQAGVGLIAAHTNLDKAEGGVSDTLAARLGLTDVTVTDDDYTRIGKLAEPMTAKAFAAHVAQALDTSVRYSGDKTVTTVAVCGGGGGDFIAACMELADAYVTGEVKHHEWLAAAGHVNTVEAGHYATEAPIVDTLCTWLQEAFPQVAVTPYRDGEPYLYTR